MPIPYGPAMRNGRKNRGFKDLRGKPEQAAAISEARESPMLRELLAAAALPAARLFTVGCDLGGHRLRGQRKFRWPEVKGGYIQFALRDYAEATPEEYLLEARSFEDLLRPSSRGHRWRVVMHLRHHCIFRLGQAPETIAPTLAVHFWASGFDAAAALMSREALLAALKGNLLACPCGDI
ncbi:MAG: hypothetical protein QOD40_3210 [Alphaproteobacteria bacterium]|nr:hypothetical protein [Alphaproteobacteria bacterium]